MKSFLPITFILLIGCHNPENLAPYLEFQATVDGQQIASEGFPEGTITFDDALTYIGSETFILYDVARCEIHLFGEADEAGHLSRLYWIQYEGYLPRFFPLKYNYKSDPLRAEIAGRPFFESVNYYNIGADRPNWRDGSDIEHVFALIEANGYRLEGDVMRTRLVHLDEKRKNELMIIYIEPLAAHGLSEASFGEKGRASEEWLNTSEALRMRAQEGMRLVFE